MKELKTVEQTQNAYCVKSLSNIKNKVDKNNNFNETSDKLAT